MFLSEQGDDCPPCRSGKMRKGYLLVEMIVIIAILVMLALTLDRLTRTIIYEIPRDNRLVQEGVVLRDAVKHIRADVASAKTVSRRAGDSAEANTLIIQLPDGIVRYEFEKGRILRQRVTDIQASAAGRMSWSVPHGKIETQVWNKDQKGYAVEVSTCIEDKNFGHIRRMMANSYLFFAGTLLGTAE